MYKKVFGRKLSRERGTRTALFRSLIRSLIQHGKIETTKAKARAIYGDVERLVKTAKAGSLASRRKILGELGNDRQALDTLFSKVVPNFKDRKSGFIKLILLPRRKGDLAEMVRLEWVSSPKEKTSSKKIETKTERPKK